MNIESAFLSRGYIGYSIQKLLFVNRIWKERIEPYLEDMPTNSASLIETLTREHETALYGIYPKIV